MNEGDSQQRTTYRGQHDIAYSTHQSAELETVTGGLPSHETLSNLYQPTEDATPDVDVLKIPMNLMSL